MYEDKVKEIEKTGFKTGISSLLYNSTLESVLEGGCNKYELKKALAPKLEKILRESKEYYEENLDLAGTVEYLSEDIEAYMQENESHLDSIKTAIEKYDKGKPININGLRFCNADKGPTDEINYKMFPTLSFVGNALFYAGFVPYAIGLPTSLITGNSTLLGVGAASITAGFGCKFLGKGLKAFFKKQQLQTFYNSALTLGAFSITESVVNPAKSLMFNFLPGFLAYTPAFCATLFNIHIMLKFLKFIFSREKIKDPLPSLEEVTKDFENQVKRYTELKKHYKKIPIREIPLKKKGFVKEMKSVNKYLKYHLKKIKLQDIDVDVDNLIGMIIGAAARADLFTDTAEFCTFKYANQKSELSNMRCANEKDRINLTAGLFAKIYSHEITHLDGIINEGRANYSADKVLEDLAIYRPNEGYDLELEKGKFDAVSHVYSLLRLEELNRKGISLAPPMKPGRESLIKYTCNLVKEELKSVVKRVKHRKPIRKSTKEREEEYTLKMEKFTKLFRKYMINDLRKKGVKDKADLQNVLRWLYPGLVRRGLFKMQSIVGGSNPKGGYTVDHYKLMKRDTTFIS